MVLYCLIIRTKFSGPKMEIFSTSRPNGISSFCNIFQNGFSSYSFTDPLVLYFKDTFVCFVSRKNINNIFHTILAFKSPCFEGKFCNAFIWPLEGRDLLLLWFIVHNFLYPAKQNLMQPKYNLLDFPSMKFV